MNNMIGVEYSNKSFKYTAEDKRLKQLVREIIDEEEKAGLTIGPKPLDVVIFDEPNWLEIAPANTAALYNGNIQWDKDTNIRVIGLRKVYLLKVLRSDKEKIRSLIKHELVHVHLDPHQKNKRHPHGNKFKEQAKTSGLKDGFEDYGSRVSREQWKMLHGGKR